VRLAALGPEPAASAPAVDGSHVPREGTRSAQFADETVETSVRSRTSISVEPESGPLLVDEYDTTVVVPPAWTVRRDEDTATLILERA
jgi:N-methylhydantoinase A/oxoprolinase/acetone carboxylase beta subunit